MKIKAGCYILRYIWHPIYRLLYFSPSISSIKLRHNGGLTTTAYANYCRAILPRYADFSEEGKPEYPEKNPLSTGDINYEKYQMYTRLAFIVVRSSNRLSESSVHFYSVALP